MSLRMAALGLIAQQPDSTGYDLMKRFERSLAQVWPATQSQLYGELNRLHGDGLIEVSAVGPRGRKEYRITEQGRPVLRTWLADTSLEPLRNPLLLKVFLLSETDERAAMDYLHHVQQQTRSVADRLDKLESEIDWTDSTAHVLARAVLEWGTLVCSVQESWLAGTANRLRTVADQGMD